MGGALSEGSRDVAWRHSELETRGVLETRFTENGLWGRGWEKGAQGRSFRNVACSEVPRGRGQQVPEGVA